MKKFVAILSVALGTLIASNAYADVYFKSPSGNIKCAADSSSVDCVILSTHSGVSAPVYEDCHANHVSLSSSGRPEGICESDFAYSGFAGSVPVLGYGQTKRGNGWSCTSAKTGMTCRNSSGHGFSMSKANIRFF